MYNTLLISINDTLSVNRNYAKIFKCEPEILEYINSDFNDDIIYRMMERNCMITRLTTVADLLSFPSTTVLLSKQISNIITLINKGSVLVHNIRFDKKISAICNYDDLDGWQSWIQNQLHKMSRDICIYNSGNCLTPITYPINSHYTRFIENMETLCKYNVSIDKILSTVGSIVNSTMSEAESIITQIMHSTTPMSYDNITSTFLLTTNSMDTLPSQTTEETIHHTEVCSYWNILNITGMIGGVITTLGILGVLINRATKQHYIHKAPEHNTDSLEEIESNDQDKFYDAVTQIDNNPVHLESRVSYNNEKFYDAPPPKPQRSNQNTYDEHIYEELSSIDHFNHQSTLKEGPLHHQIIVDAEVHDEAIDIVGGHIAILEGFLP